MSPLEKQSMLVSGRLISIQQAALGTPYSAEYLSLLARKGKIQAVKISRDWLTTNEAVREYVEEQRKKHEKFLALSVQSGFIGLKTLLVSLCLLIISFESFFISHSFSRSPRKLLSAIPKTINLEHAGFVNRQVLEFGQYFSVQTKDAVTALGENIINDAESVKDVAGRSGSQVKQLAVNFSNDFKAPYLAAGKIIQPALTEQKSQLLWTFSQTVSGWKDFALFLKPGFQDFAKIQTKALAEQMRLPGQLVSLAKNKINNSVRKFAIEVGLLRTAPHVTSLSLGWPEPGQDNITANNEAATGDSGVNSKAEILGISTSAVDSNYINQLIDNRFNQYLQEGKFNFAAGSQPGGQGWSGTGILQSDFGKTTAVIGGIPVVTYVPSNSEGTFRGGTIAGFSELSSNNLISSNNAILNNLAVSGPANFYNSTTFATTTIANLVCRPSKPPPSGAGIHSGYPDEVISDKMWVYEIS